MWWQRTFYKLGVNEFATSSYYGAREERKNHCP